MQIYKALDAYLLQLQADGRSEHTIEQYVRHVELLEAWLTLEGLEADLSAVSHQTVAQFLASPAACLRPDGKKKLPTSTNALRTSIRCFFRFAVDAGFARENAGRLVRRALCNAPPPRGLTPEEAQRLLATLAEAKGRAAERDYALFHLLLATGLRVSSALALVTADVDLENGEISIRIAKGGQRGRVFLGAAIRDHLGHYLGGRSEGHVFPGRKDGHICRRFVQDRLGHWLKRAGIRHYSPHSLRHSFAMRLYSRTGDLGLVQGALFHRSLASTLVYAQADEGRLRAALGCERGMAEPQRLAGPAGHVVSAAATSAGAQDRFWRVSAYFRKGPREA